MKMKIARRCERAKRCRPSDGGDRSSGTYRPDDDVYVVVVVGRERPKLFITVRMMMMVAREVPRHAHERPRRPTHDAGVRRRTHRSCVTDGDATSPLFFVVMRGQD